MKDEIKEILDQLEWYKKIGKKDVYYPKCVLPNKKAFLLLDYITNLQKENKQLKEKIKKVIKCIKNQYYEKEYRTKGTFVNKLMVILGDQE